MKLGLNSPYLVGLGRDGASVIYAAPEPDNNWAWRELRIDGAAPAAPIVALDDQGPIRAAAAPSSCA